MDATDIFLYIAWPLLGATLGATVSFLYIRHLAGVKTAIELHEDFHSEAFLESRIEADKVLKRLVAPKKRIRISTIYEHCSSDEWFHVSRVFHFFEKLVYLREHRLAHRGTTDVLFGHYISHYKRDYFAKFVETDEDWRNLVRTLNRLPTVKA